MLSDQTIAIVIPCFKVKSNILALLDQIGDFVDHIFIVDDKCPENSGKYVEQNCHDPRVNVIYHDKNMGVGGAVKTGFVNAIDAKCSIVVKLDGDGQMDPALIESLIQPIIDKEADYVKGNRFFNLNDVRSMPRLRLVGNSVLSLLNKFVNGYWNIMDPTNGFVAIHHSALIRLDLDKIENRYFFESDMLFRLALNKAVVQDFPMTAIYQGEHSSLKIGRILLDFPLKYLTRFIKRIFYMYFLRDFNLGTIQFLLGTGLFLFGLIFGIVKWISSVSLSKAATAGTVMLSALPLILGFQLLLSALSYDLQNVPKIPLQKHG